MPDSKELHSTLFIIESEDWDELELDDSLPPEGIAI